MMMLYTLIPVNFYDNYMVLNPRKCDFMGFGNTNENEVFTYH